MAKKAKKVSPLKEQYMKERRRIQSFIRRAQKRGYDWKETPLPPIPKKITQGSINRLQKLTPKSLYEKARYTTTKRDPSGHLVTKEVSAAQGREIERSNAGRKGYLNRRQALDEGFKSVQERNNFYLRGEKPKNIKRPKVKDVPKYEDVSPTREVDWYGKDDSRNTDTSKPNEWQTPSVSNSSDEDWYTPDEWKVKNVLDELAQQQGYDNYGRMKRLKELERIQKENEGKPLFEYDSPDRPLVGGVSYGSNAETAIHRIQEIINSSRSEKGRTLLNDMLAGQINRYGREAVGNGIANAPENFWEEIQNVLNYGADSNAIAGSIRMIANAILGEIPQGWVNDAINDVADEDEWYDEEDGEIF